MKKLAQSITGHFKMTLSVWLAVTIILAFFALELPSKLKGDGFEIAGEYENVQDRLVKDFDFPESTLIVVFNKEGKQSEEEFNKRITDVLSEIEETTDTAGIQSPLDQNSQYAGHVAYAAIEYDQEIDDMSGNVEKVRAVTDSFDDVMLTGEAVISEDLNEASMHDLKIAEMIGIPVALLVLLAAFGSFVAAIVPLLIGGISVVISLGILTLLGDHLNLSVFLLNVAPMICLALSIDFALLFINRYKEEIETNTRKEAIKKTIETAGKSILFSALCVFIGLGAMMIIEVDIFRTVAIGGMVVVVVSVISSLTLLPSILMLIGQHLDKGKIFKTKKDSNKKWRNFAQAVMKRPVIISILAAALLLVCITPVKDLVLAIPDEKSLPLSYESREAFSIINKEFGLKDDTVVYFLAERDGGWTSEDGLKDMEILVSDIKKDELVKSAESLFSVSKAGDHTALHHMLQAPESKQLLEPAIGQFIEGDRLFVPVTLDAEADSGQAKDFVRDWSTKDYPLELQVGGEAKFNQEIFDEIFGKVGIGIGIVLVSTYLILMAAFRSVVIPLKAIIMNVLGLTSTFGILVWLFQEGHFGLDPSNIALIIPVFVFSLVFGLSMDYEVFLISRIHEKYLETGDNDIATIDGLTATSKIITSAALIMIVITGAFAFTGVVPVKQIGIGIAIAIFIDATVIRLLLVPSLMKLMGDWNWWMPFTKKKAKAQGK